MLLIEYENMSEAIITPQPSEYLKQLSEMFRQQGELTRLSATAFGNHGTQLIKLNELIFDQCQKEKVDIETLNLNA